MGGRRELAVLLDLARSVADFQRACSASCVSATSGGIVTQSNPSQTLGQ